ncbi:male accessory gland serine protease inhibitor-like [Stomoxys calcitrans]|uniref:male accessory gland serine protease inhibitor-like n=1 Tax=Stomoxys calcitrans TaxID=35570 RepID=UPI0027E28846|nr:male accessory gland serine protease inhibitor-like [Stomoxys calcitrans]
MNIISVILFFTTMVLVVNGQCRNAPAQPNCGDRLNTGHGGHGCHRGARWWYDRSSNSCKEFSYHGCGGNQNRWCSKAACENRCRRH